MYPQGIYDFLDNQMITRNHQSADPDMAGARLFESPGQTLLRQEHGELVSITREPQQEIGTRDTPSVPVYPRLYGSGEAGAGTMNDKCPTGSHQSEAEHLIKFKGNIYSACHSTRADRCPLIYPAEGYLFVIVK